MHVTGKFVFTDCRVSRDILKLSMSSLKLKFLYSNVIPAGLTSEGYRQIGRWYEVFCELGHDLDLTEMLLMLERFLSTPTRIKNSTNQQNLGIRSASTSIKLLEEEV